jgi:hypothetical protein
MSLWITRHDRSPSDAHQVECHVFFYGMRVLVLMTKTKNDTTVRPVTPVVWNAILFLLTMAHVCSHDKTKTARFFSPVTSIRWCATFFCYSACVLMIKNDAIC